MALANPALELGAASAASCYLPASREPVQVQGQGVRLGSRWAVAKSHCRWTRGGATRIGNGLPHGAFRRESEERFVPMTRKPERVTR